MSESLHHNLNRSEGDFIFDLNRAETWHTVNVTCDETEFILSHLDINPWDIDHFWLWKQWISSYESSVNSCLASGLLVFHMSVDVQKFMSEYRCEVKSNILDWCGMFSTRWNMMSSRASSCLPSGQTYITVHIWFYCPPIAIGYYSQSTMHRELRFSPGCNPNTSPSQTVHQRYYMSRT